MRDRSQVQGDAWLISLLKDNKDFQTMQHFVLVSQLSSELTAELISLMRTAYQGCLGVRV